MKTCSRWLCGLVLAAAVLMALGKTGVWSLPGESRDGLAGSVAEEGWDSLLRKMHLKKQGVSPAPALLSPLHGKKLRLYLYLHCEVPDQYTAVVEKRVAEFNNQPQERMTAELTGGMLNLRETLETSVISGGDAVPEDWREKLAELTELCTRLVGVRPQPAVILVSGGEEPVLSVQESREGFGIAAEETAEKGMQRLQRLYRRLQDCPADVAVLSIPVKGRVLTPSLTTEQAKQCNTRIAQFATAYAGAGSGRARNLAVGAAHLNGQVVLPGEEFSTAAALMPFSAENGYTAGGTYVDGRVEESMGGGVCQLSTTLYNAVLRTKLTITKRSAHSMPVAYIAPGWDAAIAGDYKDFCFRNTSGAPVLLLCRTTGREVIVTLYGCAGAASPGVRFLQKTTKKNDEELWVETYREVTGENGKGQTERLFESHYSLRKKN